ncbi:MAG: hypothetical protein GXO46_07145 [Chlorobi bacterium]|nr:hypothetical protein [Chlorobiota bacterium]
MLTEQEINRIAEDHIDKSGKKPGIKLSLFKEATTKKNYGMIFLCKQRIL